MPLKKIVIISSVILFSLIITLSFFKKKEEYVSEDVVQNISIEKVKEKVKEDLEIAEVDRIDKLFAFDSSKLPVVKTMTYTSRVPWLSGRPAWIADYAAHFKTTRHFIARSLNKNLDYFTQKVSHGDRFNVLKESVTFHLLIDISRLKMWFYGVDNNKYYLLKIYNVGLGRKDSSKESKCLTPKGKFSLGSKVAIYKSGVLGYFQDRQIEMVKIFGTRWIPFKKEIEKCSDRAKGYGLHGAPFVLDSKTNNLKEDRGKVGKYDSDGCIRLYKEAIEELFAIVISRSTIIELVDDIKDFKMKGEEVVLK